MSNQANTTRGFGLKRIGIGLVSASLVAVATACSTAVLPAPAVAPNPTVAPIAAAIVVPVGRTHALEMFRYTPASSASTPAPVTRHALEFYRYASPAITARPLEMFRYTPTASASTQLPATRRSLEFYRYDGQPR